MRYMAVNKVCTQALSAYMICTIMHASLLFMQYLYQKINGQGQKFFPWHILWSVKIHKKLNTHQIKVHNFNNLWHNICMKPPKPYKLSINVTCYGT